MPRIHESLSSNIIGSRILTNLGFLKRLCRSRSDKRRWRLLHQATTEELLALVEICSNILKPKQFCLSHRQVERLQHFAPTVRELARKRTERGARQLVVQQGSGAFFSALLAPIIAEAARLALNRLI